MTTTADIAGTNQNPSTIIVSIDALLAQLADLPQLPPRDASLRHSAPARRQSLHLPASDKLSCISKRSEIFSKGPRLVLTHVDLRS
jgi:hypothetical protein